MCTGGGGVRSKLNVYYTTIPESDVANVVFGYVNTIILRHVLLTIQQFLRIGKVFSSQVQRQRTRVRRLFSALRHRRGISEWISTPPVHIILLLLCVRKQQFTPEYFMTCPGAGLLLLLAQEQNYSTWPQKSIVVAAHGSCRYRFMSDLPLQTIFAQ